MMKASILGSLGVHKGKAEVIDFGFFVWVKYL